MKNKNDEIVPNVTVRISVVCVYRLISEKMSALIFLQKVISNIKEEKKSKKKLPIKSPKTTGKINLGDKKKKL